MITLLQASRRCLLVILPGFALLFAGCAKEAEETSPAGTATIASTTTEADVSDSTGSTVAKTETEPLDAHAPEKLKNPPLIIPDTPGIPVAGSDAPDKSHSAWLTDYALAKERAAAENKTILMDFTGSDWCGWCIRLHDEVFRFPEFQEYAEKNLILLELDFPQRKQLPPALTAQNEQLQEQFAVEGFPSIFLVDAEGRAIARTGYQAGGPGPYIEHLKVFLDTKAVRDREFAAAEKAEGVERAKHLADAVLALDTEIMFTWYQPVIDEILKLDAQDEGGLKTQFTGLMLEREVTEKLAALEMLLRRSDDEEKIMAEFTKLETEYEASVGGLAQIRLLKLQVLAAFEKHEELLVLAELLGQVADLSERDRVMVLSLQTRSHDQTGRPEKGLELIDAVIGKFKEPEAEIQLNLIKAQVLVGMGQTDEAKKAIAVAEEVAPEELKGRVRQIGEQVLDTPPRKKTEPAEGETKPAADAPNEKTPEKAADSDK